MKERIQYWCEKLKVNPRQIRIQRMKYKWGSCSTLGTITIATDLLDQNVGFQDYVIVHELLHLRYPNHGKLFKATLAAHIPNWREMELARRHG